MSETNKINRKKFKKIVLFFITLFAISSIYFIYNILLLSGIEDLIRYIGVGVSLLIDISLLLWIIKNLRKRKLKSTIISLTLLFLLAAIYIVGGYYINKAYSSINNMNKNEVIYGTSLVVLKDSGMDSISDLSNKKIGIIKDTSSVEGYVISQEIIKDEKINKNNLVQYEDFLSMLNDLYEEKVDAIFISSGYVSMFSSIDHFADIKNETLVLKTKEKKMPKQNNTSSSGSKITKPFTMLVMGVDSTEEDIKSATSFNGDSLILVTFNPSTLNATMMSIPRDTFVPIMCFKNHIQNKITHAAWYGESCMMDTIENFTGINIDYYVKINFKGVVKLVDALGGVDVDVPYNFCEQNSNREWGKNTIFVEKGFQTLNGEEALAFARNRHPNPQYCSKKWTNYTSNDFIRGQNQQTVIQSMVGKLKDIRDINKLYEVLDLIEKSMDTNLSTSQILSFYDIGKKILALSKNQSEILSFQKLYLSTYGEYIYDEGMKLELSDQIYYKGSLDDVVEAMKINLGLKDPTIIKTFGFSANEIYEETVIGKGTYNEPRIALVPDFTKYTKTTATAWGTKNNVELTFKTVESSNSSYVDGQIINQSVPRNSLVSIAKTKGITITVVKKTSTIPEKVDCKDEDNKDNSLCIIPDFVKDEWTVSRVNTWKNKITGITVSLIEGDTTDTESKDKVISSQNNSYIGKSIYDLSITNLTLEYYVYDDPLNDVMPD